MRRFLFALALIPALYGAAHANLLASAQLPVPVSIAPTSLSVTSAVATGGTLTGITVTTAPVSTFNGTLTLTTNPSNLFGLSGYNLTSPPGLTASNNGSYSPVVQACENGTCISQTIATSVNIVAQQGCLSDSVCPPPPAGFHWALDYNADFTQGVLPADWGHAATGGMAMGTDIVNCDNGALTFTSQGIVMYGTGSTEGCFVGTWPGENGSGKTFGPGFFEFNARASGQDDLTWMASQSNRYGAGAGDHAQTFSQGFEIDLPEAGRVNVFWSGYGVFEQSDYLDHVGNFYFTDTQHLHLRGLWWNTVGQDMIVYQDGVQLFAPWFPPDGAGVGTGQGAAGEWLEAGNIPQAGTTENGVGTQLKWFRHYTLTPN